VTFPYEPQSKHALAKTIQAVNTSSNTSLPAEEYWRVNASAVFNSGASGGAGTVSQQQHRQQQYQQQEDQVLASSRVRSSESLLNDIHAQAEADNLKGTTTDSAGSSNAHEMLWADDIPELLTFFMLLNGV